MNHTIRVRHRQTLIGFFDAGHVGICPDIHSMRPHAVCDVFNGFGIETAQNLIPAIELQNLGAQTVHDPSEFRCDISATNDYHTFWQSIQMKHLI